MTEGHVARKPDLVACEQQWRRPGCAFMQSDPRRCYSLNTKYLNFIKYRIKNHIGDVLTNSETFLLGDVLTCRRFDCNPKRSIEHQLHTSKESHSLRTEKKQASKDLRKQVRKEFAMDRQKFLGEVMDHPSDQNFYRLIKLNQGQKEKTVSGCIRFKGEDIFDSEIQGKNFSVYFEDLALPKNNNSFDKEFYQLNKVQHACIREICEQSEDVITPFSAKKLQDSVRSLNVKKAPDEFGLVSEHLKYGLKPLLPLLVNIYNEIIASGIIPANFKSGIIHPIHKKAKDPTSMDNYRGITVTSVFGKLFEILLLTRMTDLNHNQSDLQYGFTKGLTLTRVSLILSEAEADAKMRNSLSSLLH